MPHYREVDLPSCPVKWVHSTHFHSLLCLAEASRLGHAIKKGTLRSDGSRRKGERRSSWEETVSWTREAVLERESAPELVCKVLESERASEKGRTEGVDSATEGQSLLPSGLRHRRGNEVIERSTPFSTSETCWGAS